jgi:hypothetical protein
VANYKFTTKEFNDYLLKEGKSAKKIISVLAKNSAFMAAMGTSIGQEILKDVVIRMEEILDLIVEEKDDADIRAELRALKHITNTWAQRVNSTQAAAKKAKGEKI